MSDSTIERLAYGGWPNCYRLSNGDVELIATSDVGPRVIRFGFTGGQNFFVEIADQLGKSGESWWAMRGGHRLWISPEVKPDTYALDNSPVEAKIEGSRLILRQNVEPETRLQKEIVLELSGTEVKLTHSITNRAKTARRLAPWALSQMARGGMAIVPFPSRGGHSEQLLPTNPLVMWAYTDFSDERWGFAKTFLTLRQNPKDSSPQKTGLFRTETIAAYLLGSELFVKRSQADPDLPYPDFHCSLEIFTNGDFLELETLGPLTDLQAGASVEHVERWSLHRDVQPASLDNAAIEKTILPLLG